LGTGWGENATRETENRQLSLDGNFPSERLDRGTYLGLPHLDGLLELLGKTSLVGIGEVLGELSLAHGDPVFRGAV
jgi:hypothetical protein